MRYRERSADHRNTAEFAKFVFQDETHGSALWGPALGNILEYGSYSPNSSQMWDVVNPKAYRPHGSDRKSSRPSCARVYSECAHDSVQGDYSIPVAGMTGAENTKIVIARPLANPNLTDGAKSDECPNPWLVEHAKSVLGEQIGLVPHTIEEAQTIFYRSDLPRDVQIDRDPFETDFSVWFLVVDLFDWKRNVSSLFSRQAAVRGFREAGIPKGWSARKVADHHLGVKFGLIPFLNDVQAFISRLKTWREAYDRVSTLPDKRYTFHRKMDLKFLYPTKTFEINSQTPLGAEVRCTCVQETRQAYWHAQTLYGFRCPEFQGWVTRLYQLSDAFGVTDLAALWDVVPFSFIVDWFFTVSSWLHKHSPKLFPASVVVYDYLESVTLETTRTYSLTFNGPTPVSPFYTRWENILIGEDTYKTYVRKRFRPEPNQVTLLTGLKRQRSFVNINRVGIASSLLAQRVPR